MRLYEIPLQIREVLESAVDPETGELTEEGLQRLADLQMTLEHKADAYAALIREYGSAAAAVRAEMDRLKKLLQSHESAAEQFERRLKQALEAAGLPKVETPRFKISLRKSPPSATCLVDPATLPAELQRVKTTVEANNKAAIEAFKVTGKVPEGFEIRQGTSLQIK